LSLRVWLDIENPPQVQYLVPLVRAFERRDAEVLLTARDYGITFELLADRGIEFTPVGRHFGARKAAKVAGTARRIVELRSVLSKVARRDLVVSASRSASLAARSSGIPAFALCDYEYVNLYAFRLARAYVVHPDVIPSQAFVARGVRPSRLVPFRGIKEDITFADLDVTTVDPYELPGGLAGSERVVVLVRPPAEESHYHRGESTELFRDVLAWLARDERVVVVFSPRYEWQVDRLAAVPWHLPPVVLTTPVPFASLLAAVDVVVSGGGTMTREAAYLGVPAVSIFRGQASAVDRYLQRMGRLLIVDSSADLHDIDLRRLERSGPLNANPRAAEDVVDAVTGLARVRR
jgi:predicted glycosyltransferase